MLREGNEDSAYAGPRLLAIADGMGGHAAGEVASAVAIAAIAPLDEQNLTDSEDMLDALAAAVAAARNTLHDMSVSDPAVEGMGTTLTALLWAGAQVAVCHIGDSRAYLLRDGDLYQITRDHTLIQSLVDEGREPGSRRQSPAAIPDHAGAAGQHRRRSRPGDARGPARRPVPALLRRPHRRRRGRGRARGADHYP